MFGSDAAAGGGAKPGEGGILNDPAHERIRAKRANGLAHLDERAGRELKNVYWAIRGEGARIATLNRDQIGNVCDSRGGSGIDGEPGHQIKTRVQVGIGLVNRDGKLIGSAHTIPFRYLATTLIRDLLGALSGR